MDTYREHPGDFEDSSEVPETEQPRVAAIGTDERRMHVRAYNYWVSLLDGRDYPSIEDLEPGDLLDFAPNSVLLDFTSGRESPAAPYIGAAIRAECDLAEDVQSIDDVPKRSLLSRLTDHYMQIIANRAPIGFEAEFENQRGENICYRGILMPFSSDGDTIDFIYGVINWKTVGVSIEAAVAAAAGDAAPETNQFDAGEDVLDLVEPVLETSAFEQSGDIETGDQAEELPTAEAELGDDAGLGDRLWAARESVEAAKAAEGRSREALYLALSRAYDFALASLSQPDDYAELLEESGVKAQARAPMTPVVKLVFGADYDKARLTEYSAALAYAQRQSVDEGGFLDFINDHAGGLKALVAAERQARRPEPKANTKTEKAREKLRAVRPLALEAISSESEFALVLTRRSSGGIHEAVAVVEDPAMVERAIRKVGG